jgi:hypothetical protein
MGSYSEMLNFSVKTTRSNYWIWGCLWSVRSESWLFLSLVPVLMENGVEFMQIDPLDAELLNAVC